MGLNKEAVFSYQIYLVMGNLLDCCSPGPHCCSESGAETNWAEKGRA